MIQQFLEQYGPQAVAFIGTVGALMPFLRQRIVNDKTIMKQFETVKSVTKEVSDKGVAMAGSLAKLENLTQSVGDRFEKIEVKVENKLAQLDKSIVNFQESEIFQKMQRGLEQLDKLEQTIQNKDDTIALLGGTIKKLETELQAIKNRLE